MRLLVTGSQGFIGSHLTLMGAIPIKNNILDFEGLKQEIREKSEGQAFTLIHAAALTDVDSCEKDKKLAWDTNVIGTSNVMGAIPSTGRVVLLSTCQVFSGNRYFPYSEIHSPSPVNFYGQTKFAAEAVSAIFRIPSLVVRLGVVYDGNRMQKVIMSDEAVPSFLKRNFAHVDDIVNILIRIADMNFSVFPVFKKLYKVLHIGSPTQNFSYVTFYNLIRDKYKKSPLPKRELYEVRDAERPLRCEMNVSRMRKLIAYQWRSL